MTAFVRLALGLGCAAVAAPASAANPPVLHHPSGPLPDCPPDPCPPLVGAPCPPPAAACRTPKVVVEMSQPEVRFVAPSGGGSGGAGSGGAAGGVVLPPDRSGASGKFCSFLNLSINRSRTRFAGGGVGQPVTTVVPAFATATIPIALQTTQFAAATESAVLGGRGLTQVEAAELIRDLVRRESARQESAPAPAASCADLKARVDRIEQRLDQIEKKVEGIAGKLDKLTAGPAGLPPVPTPPPGP
ncbi:MAG: hypothetical protein C0501_30700 [Isosphaera sp.]|nr:hypothetical protein [Isosphaera sp.]